MPSLLASRHLALDWLDCTVKKIVGVEWVFRGSSTSYPLKKWVLSRFGNDTATLHPPFETSGRGSAFTRTSISVRISPPNTHFESMFTQYTHLASTLQPLPASLVRKDNHVITTSKPLNNHTRTIAREVGSKWLLPMNIESAVVIIVIELANRLLSLHLINYYQPF